MSLKKAIDIYKGYKNLIKDKMLLLDEEEQELFDKRYDICKVCLFRNKTIDSCMLCNCYLPAKTKCLECKCPKEYW